MSTEDKQLIDEVETALKFTSAAQGPSEQHVIIGELEAYRDYTERLLAALKGLRENVNAQYWDRAREDNTQLRAELEQLRAEQATNRAPGYCGWAVVELLGHRRYAGRVTPVRQFGVDQLQLDVPQPDDAAAFTTHFYGGGSVYGLHPCAEDIARAVASSSRPTPVHAYEMPRRPQLGAGEDADELEHCGHVHSPYDDTCPREDDDANYPPLDEDEIHDLKAEQLEAAEAIGAGWPPGYDDEPVF